MLSIYCHSTLGIGGDFEIVFRFLAVRAGASLHLSPAASRHGGEHSARANSGSRAEGLRQKGSGTEKLLVGKQAGREVGICRITWMPFRHLQEKGDS